MQLSDHKDYVIAPDPNAVRLTRSVQGFDQHGEPNELAVVEERPLTIFLNSREIVTAMTIGDYPEYLALGFLRNQGMLADGESVLGVDFDEELETVVVRTDGSTVFEEKLKKKTRTSGCAVGTVFGDMMEGLDQVVLMCPLRFRKTKRQGGENTCVPVSGMAGPRCLNPKDRGAFRG